jgi:hypothetical protein
MEGECDLGRGTDDGFGCLSDLWLSVCRARVHSYKFKYTYDFFTYRITTVGSAVSASLRPSV